MCARVQKEALGYDVFWPIHWHCLDSTGKTGVAVVAENVMCVDTSN